MRAVSLAPRGFLLDPRWHHVLVWMENISVVSYINHQGVLRSGNLYVMARKLLLWAQGNLRSLRATHVPGIQNLGVDHPGEWSLNPQTVHWIWSVFGRAGAKFRQSEQLFVCFGDLLLVISFFVPIFLIKSKLKLPALLYYIRRVWWLKSAWRAFVL